MTYQAPVADTGFLRLMRELRHIRSQLRDLRQSTRIGFWQYRFPDKTFHASREAFELADLPMTGGEVTARCFLRRVQRDDRRALLSALGRALPEAETHLNIVLRLTGGNRPMRRIGLHAWRTDEAGQARWFGIVHLHDISLASLADPCSAPDDGPAMEAIDMVGARMAPLGGWQFDLRRQQILMTSECADILELPASGMLVRSDTGDFRTVPPFAPVQDALARCVSDGTPFDRIERTLTAQGREIWLRVTGHAVRDDSGAIEAIQAASQDLTLTMRAESALGLLSRKLARAIDIQYGACLALDTGLHIMHANRKATHLLKTSRKALIGQRVTDVFRLDAGDIGIDTGDLGASLRARLSTGEALTLEACHLPLGAWFDLRLVSSFDGIEMYFDDITARKETETALRLSEERFKIIARATSDGIFDWDSRNDTLWTNEGMVDLFDFPAREIRDGKKAWLQCIHPADRQDILASFTEANRADATDWTGEYRLRRRDGSYAIVQNRAFFIRDSRGKTIRAIGAITDITEKKMREAERQKYEHLLRQQASLLDRARDAISVSDLDGRILYWNKGAQRLFGWAATEAVGRKKIDLIVDDQSSYEHGMHTLLEHEAWAGEIRKKTRDGKLIMVEAHWTLIRDEGGRPQAILAIDTDISRRKEAEREIERLAFFDTLTHLPNRRLLMDRLQLALDSSGRNNRIGALIFIDLDNFKRLNDTLGHDKGDLLLQQVALRLERCVRRNNTVARLGGDEFVILIDDLSDAQREAMTQARAVAENVIAAFRAPFQLNEHSIHSTPSIGVTLFRHRTEHHLTTVEELLKRADLAMYQAKASGRNAIRFFDPEMQSVMNARVALETDLRHGMQREEFMLQYQPQTDASGRITGTEALVRWQHPERGVISPNLFIPLAEETGLILSLGNWILHTACQQLAQWASQTRTAHLTMAVNVSPRQFRHPDFVQQVTDALLSTGANPRQLKLELTESLLIENIEGTVMKMAALKKLGVSFSLDDFGTGYSSLAYLKRLPIDQLKIDQSFVKDVLENPNDAAIARTIVALGQTLGLEVIAEGVETEDQRAFLARNGCNAYQGYLFSLPRPGESFFH